MQFRQPSFPASSSIYPSYNPSATHPLPSSGVLPPYQQYFAAVAAAAAAAASPSAAAGCYPSQAAAAASMDPQFLQQQMYYQNLVQYQTLVGGSTAESAMATAAAPAASASHPHPPPPSHGPPLYGGAMGCSTDAESIATSEVVSLEESMKSPDSSIDGQAPSGTAAAPGGGGDGH